MQKKNNLTVKVSNQHTQKQQTQENESEQTITRTHLDVGCTSTPHSIGMDNIEWFCGYILCIPSHRSGR